MALSEENPNTVDFDMFWAGHTKKPAPITIKVCGKVAELNTDLSLAEMQAISAADVGNPNQLKDTLVRLFGQETYDYWLSAGMLFAQAPIIVLWGLLKLQGIEMSLQEVAEHMSSMAGKALMSSGSTGGQSKPDSNNTTALTKTSLGPLVRDGSTSS